MFLGQTIDILPFFSIVYTTNTGIAWGMFQSLKYSNIVFSIIVILVISTLVYIFLIKKPGTINKMAVLPVTLVISGATGNLIDRLIFGKVTDFLDFYIGNYHWPVFNIADSSITIGGILLGIILLCYQN
jgi:signal peptidase II